MTAEIRLNSITDIPIIEKRFIVPQSQIKKPHIHAVICMDHMEFVFRGTASFQLF